METTDPTVLALHIAATIRRLAAGATGPTCYRPPLVAIAGADDPRFLQLQHTLHPGHALPSDLLQGAQAVVAFFLPFAPEIVAANAHHPSAVHRSWAVAYVETNALIASITAGLIAQLGAVGVAAAAQPATHNFDPVSLHSTWSHKSAAVIAGLGSFGLHQMVITGAGCAGRFGSLAVGTPLPAGIVGEATIEPAAARQHCLYYLDGSCMECVAACPVHALDPAAGLDKAACYRHLLTIAREFTGLGLADVCGKCAVLGPCAMEG
ncbi:MAG TPA: epoxyqueuosine reductase [Anaerolineae bacterium]|nr:epoxyqueuosine reductase [Anaerolineae bacterium]